MTIYAGSHNVKNHENTRLMVRSTQYHIYDHYDYDFGYNIAILKLSKPLAFNQYISGIPLNLNPGNLLGKYKSMKS